MSGRDDRVSLVDMLRAYTKIMLIVRQSEK